MSRAERYRKAEAVIRRLVKTGYSSNRIQRELQKRGLGIRRKNMLKMIREAKGVKKKPHAEKHVPRKYRARVTWRRKALTAKPVVYMPKAVAVYGTVGSESRRIEMSGTGRSLYNAMLYVGKHPPKKRFLRILADKMILFPRRYLDFDEEWDEHPEVIS
jgi:hypothetical protein